MMKLKKWILLGFLSLLLLGLFFMAAVQRIVWDEEFHTEEGKIGVARFINIDWRYWGSPHALSIGGDPISRTATFQLDEHGSIWRSNRDERVITVQFSHQQWYAISLDRTDGHKWMIRFYNGKDNELLKEVDPTVYPIKLAIQNLWLTDEIVSVNSAFTNGDSQTRVSILARAWWKLIHSEDIKEVKAGFIQEIAAREFPGRKNFLPR